MTESYLQDNSKLKKKSIKCKINAAETWGTLIPTFPTIQPDCQQFNWILSCVMPAVVASLVLCCQLQMQIQKRSELQRSGKLTPTPLLQIQRKNYKLLVACSVTKGAKSLQFLSKMFIPCVSSSIINEPQSPRVGLETNSGFQSLYFGRRLRSTSRSTSIASTLSAAQLC